MMKKAYKLTFQNGKNRLVEDDAPLEHLRAVCLNRYLSDGSGELSLCKAVEEVLDQQMALRVLDEMDALRRKQWYHLPPPCDYYLRAMQAMRAARIGQTVSKATQRASIAGIWRTRKNNLFFKYGGRPHGGGLPLHWEERISMTMTITLIRGGRAKMTLYLPADSKWIAAAYDDLDAAVPEGITRLDEIQSPITGLGSYFTGMNLDDCNAMNALNRFAYRIADVSPHEQMLFSGAIGLAGADGLEDILGVAEHLDSFELIEGVTGHEALGKYLVAQGLLGIKIPEEVLPYLDYIGIGAAYCRRHNRDYTCCGYVSEKQERQTHTRL